MLSQRNLSATAEPYVSTAHWRYRVIPTRQPLISCAAHRTAGVVAHGPDVFSGTNNASNVNVVCSANLDAEHAVVTGDNRCLVNNGPPEAPMQLRQLESSVILHQQDVLGQCYSSTTVSAMARLMGHHDGQELLLAAGQANVVVLPNGRLLSVLKAGSGTPLDEASAALALLCEAGQYDIVVQYGSPLLKAASAAMPFSPLGVGRQQPVPNLEQLTADLALSIALAHISLAGGGGAPTSAASVTGAGSSSSGPTPEAAGTSTVGAALTAMDMEEVYSHLESALQVLERHGVAPLLQKEVAYCLQGVAVAFAEDVLRSTPPVLQPSPAAAPQNAPGATSALSQGQGGDGDLAESAAGRGAVADSSGRPGGAGRGTAKPSSIPSTAAAAAARRAKAVCMLRSVLWRCAPQNQNNQHNQINHQRQQGDTAAAAAATKGSSAAGSALVMGAVVGELRHGPLAASSGGSGIWVPELTSDERSELIAPLRGLLAASEHIALYGPVASGQKPYGAVQLADQELYDLAIAHLAQGVSTGWPQHILQALSYFERVAQQQQQHALSGVAGLRPHAAAAVAADVSFERCVCEALLGRRTTAAGPVDPPPPASSTTTSSPPSGAAAAAAGTAYTAPPPYSVVGEESSSDGDELALLRRLEVQLILAAGGGGCGGGGPSGAVAGLDGVSNDTVSFEVNERVGDCVSDEEGAVHQGLAAPRDAGAAAVLAKPSKDAAEAAAAAATNTMIGSGEVLNAAASGAATATAAAAAAAATPPGLQQHHQPHTAAENVGGRTRRKTDRADDVAHKYGWAESWLELSVMPCFPETAGAGSVSLARWFSDPRVILFNKLLAVRSGAEVTAALGSAVAHVSDASRQRLWQLWQAAAQAVSSATGQGVHHHQLQQQLAAVGVMSPKAPAASEAAVMAAAAGGAAHKGGGGAPLAAVLWAQSHAALQDVGPRAAAAANAVAAAAAAVGSAAASSPRVVAAAAKSIVPFGLARWGSSEGPRPSNPGGGGGGGGRIAVTAQALQLTAATVATTESVVESSITSIEAPGGGGGGSGSVTIPTPMPTKVIPAALPVAGGLVDVALAPPPAGGGVGAVAGGTADAANIPDTASIADAAGNGALWVPDAEGHLHPRPRMVTRAVMQRAAEAAAGIKDRAVTLPGAPKDWTIAGWDPAAVDEAMSREAVRRVAAVATQAICLGALAAYVGNKIVASGALQATAASGYGAAAAAVAPTVDASTAQVAAAARAVARWLDSAGMGGAAQDALGQWPLLVKMGGGQQTEVLQFQVEAASAESVARLAEQYGRGTQLDETAASALLRGWAAARAAAPSLTDPRDRSELLSGLLGGRALKVARSEAERNARMGKRVQVHRIDVEIEQLRFRPAAASSATYFFYGHGQAGAAETTVTAVVVTAGTETNRASSVPLSYCSRERVTFTFRKVPLEGGTTPTPAAATAAAPGSVWRLVDVRDAPPPALY